MKTGSFTQDKAARFSTLRPYLRDLFNPRLLCTNSYLAVGQIAELSFPQFLPFDFPALGLGQRFHKLDFPWVFKRCGFFFHMFLDLPDQLLGSFITWTQANFWTATSLNGVAFGGNTFVAAGGNNSILQSGIIG
ncbi:MAG: hypothetical protein ACYC21_03615 [Eubacteriales bacterium]